MCRRGASCSFVWQVPRTAEKPDLWREGCIPLMLDTAASPPTSCCPACKNHISALLQLHPIPRSRRALNKLLHFWESHSPSRQVSFSLSLASRLKFEGSNVFLHLLFSHFICKGVLSLPLLPSVSDLTFPWQRVARDNLLGHPSVLKNWCSPDHITVPLMILVLFTLEYGRGIVPTASWKGKNLFSVCCQVLELCSVLSSHLSSVRCQCFLPGRTQKC